MLDSGSSLYIIDVFSKETIPLPSLESIRSSSSSVRRVGDTTSFVRDDSGLIFSDLSSDDVRGLLWVDESGKDYVVVWLFDLRAHPFISFCKKGDTHYTDIRLFYPDSHRLDGLSEMVLVGYHLYITSGQRFVRLLDLDHQGSFKDITEGNPYRMLSHYDQLCESSIAVTTSGEVLLVESDPCDRRWFRLYKKNPSLKMTDLVCHPVLEVDSLGGETLLLDLGFTVPAANGLEPDSIYFTRHNRPCQCFPSDLDICVFNLATKTLKRFDLAHMNLMDARWFLPAN